MGIVSAVREGASSWGLLDLLELVVDDIVIIVIMDFPAVSLVALNVWPKSKYASGFSVIVCSRPWTLGNLSCIKLL